MNTKIFYFFAAISITAMVFFCNCISKPAPVKETGNCNMMTGGSKINTGETPRSFPGMVYIEM